MERFAGERQFIESLPLACQPFARQFKAAGAVSVQAQQTFQPAIGGASSVQARWKSVGPAASAKTVSDAMLKKLSSLSTQVSAAPSQASR